MNKSNKLSSKYLLSNNILTITTRDIRNNDFIKKYNKFYDENVYVSIHLQFYDNKYCNFEDKTLNDFDNLLRFLFFNNKHFIIESITLDFCNLTKINEPIIELLKRNQLKILNLNNNKITNIDELANVLEFNTSLKELYLNFNSVLKDLYLKDNFYESYNSFIKVIKNNKTLKHVELFGQISKNISSIKLLIDSLKYNNTIEYMNFKDIEFNNSEELYNILSLLKYNSSIKELNLSDLYFNNNDEKFFILTDIKPIIEIISNNKNIKKLNLSNNRNIKNIELLNEILIQNNIEYLDINNCYIDTALIIDGLKNNNSLKYLNLSNNFCSNTSDLGLSLKNIKSLQELNVVSLYDYSFYYDRHYSGNYLDTTNYSKLPAFDSFNLLRFKKPNDPNDYMLNIFKPSISFKTFLISLLDNNNTLLKLNVSKMINSNEDLLALNALLIQNKTLIHLDMNDNYWIKGAPNHELIDLDIIKNNIKKYSLKHIDIRTGYIDLDLKNKYNDLISILRI